MTIKLCCSLNLIVRKCRIVKAVVAYDTSRRVKETPVACSKVVNLELTEGE
jgi:hypothetical protein